MIEEALNIMMRRSFSIVIVISLALLGKITTINVTIVKGPFEGLD